MTVANQTLMAKDLANKKTITLAQGKQKNRKRTGKTEAK
mgnify:CR=1 FL=1